MGEKPQIKARKTGGSLIFQKNRCMGFVSNHIPAAVRYFQRRKDNIIYTCIGRSFQLYTAGHFRLLHVSPLHPDDITALASSQTHIFTASNKCIYAWKAAKHMVHQYPCDSNVHTLLPFGKQHLLSVDDKNSLKVWDIESEQIYLEVPFQRDEFAITAVAHPPTYINKVVLGSKQGSLKIWNIKNNLLVHTFNTSGDTPSAVTCIEPSPALDVVAVGHRSGLVVLLNLKYDEILMTFSQDWGTVLQISFRTDSPIMATSSSNGNVAFWNLEEKKLTGQIQAHEGAVTTASFLPCEPLLLTTSPDNSMKLWIFDLPNDGARMLRIREGHSGPPTCIRYHGPEGVSIVSAGEDSSLRVFNTLSESLNKSMGKASYKRNVSKKKNRFEEDNFQMPPIVEFTTETTREREWDNIAAIHSGIIQTTTWSFHKNRMGSHRLVPEKFHNKNRDDFSTETTCVTLTHCGNFVILGYSNGDLERFNIQSGIHRASYGSPAHNGAVRGVASDNLNQFVVSGGSDGLLKYWPFKEKSDKAHTTLKFTDGVALMRSHFESSLVAVALVNFHIFIVDSDIKAVVRKFEGHTAKINDMTFNPDSKWLVSAAMDATIKVWDIPSAYMIDHFRAERPCISLSMSPTGNFLATAHVNCLGVYLWSNKMIFNQLTLRALDPFAEAPFVGLPANVQDEVAGGQEAIDELTMDLGECEIGDEIDFKYETPDQLSGDLVTLSGLPASRWQNLLDLQLIKRRNKPKAPPRKPKQAPFFLPTTTGLDLKFDVTGAQAAEAEQSRILKASTLSNLTMFGGKLQEASNEEDYLRCFNHLKQMGPSMIDFEVRSLHPDGGGSYAVMTNFLRCIECVLQTNANFELAQSYLSIFLKAHGLSILENEKVVKVLADVQKVQQDTWRRIDDQLKSNIGVISALRNFVH